MKGPGIAEWAEQLHTGLPPHGSVPLWGQDIFLFSARVQTGPGAHPATGIIGKFTGLFRGGKATGAWR